MSTQNKTPQFNSALNKILKDLKPQDKTCSQCTTTFRIYQEDIDHYHAFKVPPPTLCPRCRLQHLQGYRVNRLPIFYKKSCAAPGHDEKVISFHPENNKKVRVYDDDYWWSDNWDALESGRNFDRTKPFFSQFDELAKATPQQALQRDPTSIKCEYTISGKSSKNCYYTAVPLRSENIYYSSIALDSRNCIEVYYADHCEECYGSAFLERSHNCKFSHESFNCINSSFLFDCKNCSDCFACTNLRNKKYHLFNQSLTIEKSKDVFDASGSSNSQ